MHMMNTREMLHHVNSLTQGTTRGRVSRIKLGEVLIPIPTSLDSQDRILEIIEACENTISCTEETIHKMEMIREGMLNDLLTYGVDENGNLNHAAAEWPERRLVDLTRHIVDCPHDTPKYSNSGILIARTSDIKEGRFDTLNARRVDQATYHERIQRLEPEANDVILTREAPVGEAFIIPNDTRVCMGQRVVLIRCNSDLILPEFLLLFIYSKQFRKIIYEKSAGTTNPHLNVRDIRDLAVPTPEIQEQEKIIGQYQSVMNRIDAEMVSLQKYTDIKLGLMTDFLTGLKRVPQSPAADVEVTA